jgi:protein associated with RNAse G/E
VDVLIDTMKGMDYKKFRESKKEYYTTKDGRFTKNEVIQKMAEWLKQNKTAEPEDFLENYEVREAK